MINSKYDGLWDEERLLALSDAEGVEFIAEIERLMEEQLLEETKQILLEQGKPLHNDDIMMLMAEKKGEPYKKKRWQKKREIIQLFMRNGGSMRIDEVTNYLHAVTEKEKRMVYSLMQEYLAQGIFTKPEIGKYKLLREWDDKMRIREISR